MSISYFVTPDDVETQVFPWGNLNWLSEPRVTGTSNMATGYIRLLPGKGHDSHNHPNCEEVLYILEGKGMQTIELENETLKREVKKGDLVFVPADVSHSTLNIGNDDLIFIAVYQFSGPEAALRMAPDCKVLPPKNA